MAKIGLNALFWGGALLVASGLLYTLVWIASGCPSLVGSTSLRKPILFGLSTGVTLLSVRWVVPHLRARPGDLFFNVSLTLALVVEVVLIDLQQARGVPSHFNHSTPLDSLMNQAMLGLILWATAVLLYLSARTFTDLSMASDLALAVRWGMVLLVLGCGLGLLATLVGEQRLEGGLAPEIYGQAGQLKFPHGLPLHAIQLLPALAWCLRRLGVSLEGRLQAVAASAVAVAAATGYGLIQTFSGAARYPPVPWAWPLVLLCVAAVLVGGVKAYRARRR